MDEFENDSMNIKDFSTHFQMKTQWFLTLQNNV
jgi:hypothetical protein